MRAALLTILALTLLAADPSTISTAGPVRLGNLPTVVHLDAPTPLDSHSRFSLILRGLTTASPPGIVYNLYLNLPGAALPAKNDPRYIGQINFYGVTEEARTDRFQSFDITSQLRRALAGKPPDRGFTVTIRPVGAPSAGSNPAIQQLELIRH